MVAEGRYNGDYYTPLQAAHILRLTPARVRQLLQGGELEGERDEVGHWLIPAHVVHERLERPRRESFLEAVGSLRRAHKKGRRSIGGGKR